ncbi:hypothetical protein L1276_002883 [Flavobacterium sp. HSC-32F16]|uniref:hypothetical protein n=1 Tax=Flavobacterium sp. HSC-32F16 TaxID=2910964 RepID=UPI0020A45CFD|nr:hypothetical protein [Flavobacterium sp. HSC-32F16]MCP2027723.1 hypothetical protein [Flavobacterium sp. HSC-32F16]
MNIISDALSDGLKSVSTIWMVPSELFMTYHYAFYRLKSAVVIFIIPPKISKSSEK